ncbi:MAG: NAD(P)/FAD-dependent oxidoreductase [Alphaproteobacteria bacterium]|nr:NAD(P)/FAD-dependent oxidoreductase [Alphaproteobacteria bacterium]
MSDIQSDEKFDVIIIGAGAAGLMAAIEAGKRGRSVWLVDHATKIAEKIRISGGGRCNFTNTRTSPANYLSSNPHFCKSALKQYTQQDFISWVESHNIAFHEKALGQLFCDHSAQDIIDMLLSEAASAGVQLDMQTDIVSVARAAEGQGFEVITQSQTQDDPNAAPLTTLCESLVIAAGGLSIPKIGATKFGYDVARQFGLDIVETRAALVPLTFQADLLDRCKAMSGLSVHALVSCQKANFKEAMLFTHRGLSGPSILQVSSYWREGLTIKVDLAPDVDVTAHLLARKNEGVKLDVASVLNEVLPKKLAQDMCQSQNLAGRLAEANNAKLAQLGAAVNDWELMPAGSEGYRTAEVTLGGVDTEALSSKTMQAKDHEGLYFIGEVVDVTGHLGGYNFQWAWSSGYVAGQNV